MYECNLQIGNDNGNSEHDMVINGDPIQSPNVYAKWSRIPTFEEYSIKHFVANLDDLLFISIKEPFNIAGNYYIGAAAINANRPLTNLAIGNSNDKVDEKVPYVNTLGRIAGYAVKKMYASNEVEQDLNVVVEMSTALPPTQFSRDSRNKFRNNFMYKEGKMKLGKQIHEVTVHLPDSVKHNLKIEFKHVLVTPEAVPGVAYLESGKAINAIKEFCEDYDLKPEEVNHKYFVNQRYLAVAIGAGTTEAPRVYNRRYDTESVKECGANIGADHAIREALNIFNAENKVNFTRQEFSNAIKDPTDKHHAKAKELLDVPLEQQADKVLELVKYQLDKFKNYIEIVLVFGGGSILMKDHLKDKLRKELEPRDILLIYVGDIDETVLMEARGLYEYTLSDTFKASMERELELMGEAVV